MSITPVPGMERTTTVVIGAGLSGLAVASELCRFDVGAIVVDGLDIPGSPSSSPQTGALQRCDAVSMQERTEILRHLRNYAASHSLDIRNTTRAVGLDLLATPADGNCPPSQWAVRTAGGVLLADHIVVTRCAQSQLRRMLAGLGITVGQNLATAMRGIGMYLVGVGELITPTPKDALRQAKAVGQAISAKVHPEGTQAALTGNFAALPTSA